MRRFVQRQGFQFDRTARQPPVIAVAVMVWRIGSWQRCHAGVIECFRSGFRPIRFRSGFSC